MSAARPPEGAQHRSPQGEGTSVSGVSSSQPGRTNVAAALVLHWSDDVATALRDLEAGEWIRVQGPIQCVEMQLPENIPLCHKLALHPLSPGQPVKKYGEVIGVASQTTPAGAHVHIHNLKSTRAAV